jgi:hypothetical protein
MVVYTSLSTRPRPFLNSFLLPSDVLCDPTDLIWRKGTPFEAMTGRTAPSSDGLLSEVFWVSLGCKANARRSVHSPQDHFIITLIICDRRDWHDTRGKWSLLGICTGAGGIATESFFWPQPMAPWTTSIAFWGSVWYLWTNLFSQCKVVSLTPYLRDRGPLLLSCPWVLI